MKRLLLIVLTLLIAGTTYGQKIHFTDTANRWRTHVYGGGSIADAYDIVYDQRIVRDTPINGKTYKVIGGTITNYPVPGSHGTSNSYNNPEIALFREDTLSEIVWAIMRNTLDTDERVIYNAHWQVGDSIPGRYNYFLPGMSKVAGIDSTFYLNRWYRVFHMTDLAGHDEYDIIEGIGSTCGPFYPLIGSRFETAIDLSCFSNAGNKPTISPALGKYNHFDNGFSCNRLTVDEHVGISNLVVSPNPGGKDITIQLSNNQMWGTLIVINSIGQRVLTIDLGKEKKIPIGQYLSVAGVYYYALWDAKAEQWYRGRFIYR